MSVLLDVSLVPSINSTPSPQRLKPLLSPLFLIVDRRQWGKKQTIRQEFSRFYITPPSGCFGCWYSAWAWRSGVQGYSNVTMVLYAAVGLLSEQIQIIHPLSSYT